MSTILASAHTANEKKKIMHMSDTSAGRNYKASISALLIYSGHVLGIPTVD